MAAVVKVCSINMVATFHIRCKLNNSLVVKQKPCCSNEFSKLCWKASKSSLEIVSGSRESSWMVFRALTGDDDAEKSGIETGCPECSDDICTLPPWPPTYHESSVAIPESGTCTPDKEELGEPTVQVREKRCLNIVVPEISLAPETAEQILEPDLSQYSMADMVGSEIPAVETLSAAEDVPSDLILPKVTSESKTIAQKLSSELSNFRVNGGLMEDGFMYREKFVIRCYEVGTHKTATIEAIASLLQECACNHAQSVGFSTDGFATSPAMRKRHLIWVTTRMHIEMDEYPVWGQSILIETWYQGEAKMRTRRDWLIREENGRIIGRATSVWLMLKADTRRPSKIPDDARAEYMAFVPVPPRWAIAEEDLKAVKNIPTIERYQYSKSPLLVKKSDLDMNQHVNNVTFIGWMLESVPEEITNSHELHSIILDYKRECQRDDIVESLGSRVEDLIYDGPTQLTTSSPKNEETQDDATVATSPEAADGSQPEVYIHLLRLIEGAEINRGRTTWKKPKPKANAESGPI